jgi:hypothetical protein
MDRGEEGERELPKDSTSVDVSDEGSVINRGSIANCDKVWLGHHWIAPIWVQTDILANVRSEQAKVPNQILGPSDHVQNPNFAILSSTKLFESQIELPFLAIVRFVPGIGTCEGQASQEM